MRFNCLALGLVRDGKGDPIAGAKIKVAGIDHDIVSTDRGEYWRLLLPGDYKITVVASDFRPSEEHSITIRSLAEPVSLNFTLSAVAGNDRLKALNVGAACTVLALLLVSHGFCCFSLELSINN